MDWNQVAVLSTVFFTVITAVWSLSKYQDKQFTAVRDLVYTLVDKLEETLLKKLEYHEKHDDSRFNQIRDDIWILRVQNASKHSPGDIVVRRNGSEEKTNPSE